MRKNKFLRLASVMLMLCLITTCAISGTFAKYTTSDEALDSARVAKWGVAVQVLGNTVEMFKPEYAKDDNTFTLGTNTVISNGDHVGATGNDDLLAPGTGGDLANVVITGTPEVATRLTLVVNLDLGDNWTLSDSSVYCPIVFTVGTVTYQIGDSANDTATAKYFDTVAKLETAVENAIIDAVINTTVVPTGTETLTAVQDYVAGTTTFNVDVDASWAWAFGVADDPATDSINEAEVRDANDTYIANKATLNTPVYTTISFSLDITVDQVD